MIREQGRQGISAGLSAQVFQHMGFQPFPVPEEGAKRQSNPPMLIAFRAGWKRTGISQDVASLLDKFRLAVERMIQRQYARDRRHDATYVDSQSP
jgi:hypothetical protein